MSLDSIRQTYLPDEGCVFVKGDLSQAESRIGYMYCNTERMVKWANMYPDEYDMHSDNAVDIFGKHILELSKGEFKGYRNMGKKVVHAAWRKMGGATMSDNILKDSKGEVYMHPTRCQDLINKYLQSKHEVNGIYFRRVEEEIYSKGFLINSWGRRYDVRYIDIDDALLRKCYSFWMQSECAEITNQMLFIPGTKYLIDNYNRPMNMQIHDEVVASVPAHGVYDYCCRMKESVEVPIETPKGLGQTMIMPLEFKISDTLYGGIEFCRMPPQQEFNEQISDYLGVNI